ncbi:MAG: XdhC family protein [Calditrichaeota bacterium]|nr:MAG: XdhC family protein [Calditrichota bacterium]
MQDKKIWQFIYDQLEKNKPVALAIIVETKGSSPRKTGTKMVLTAEGEIFSSVGGGGMEHDLMQKAQHILLEKGRYCQIFEYVHSDGPQGNKSGMVCAGRQKVLLRLCEPTDLPLIAEITNLITRDQTVLLDFGPEHFTYEIPTDAASATELTMRDAETWRYVETVKPGVTVYIIGGGHVGHAVSRVLAPLDFYVHLLDNRPEYSLVLENKWVDKIDIIDYSNMAALIPQGENNFALIITSSHGDDFRVLEQLVDKNLGYLGFLASTSKANGFFNRLRKKGIAEEIIQRISAPMGVPMKSHLPEEIAISIAAELLQVKAAQNEDRSK